MTVCEQYMEKISAFMDGELSDRERLDVMEHLALCPACKDYFEDQLVIREALAAGEETAPAGFAQAVMARVEKTEQAKRRAAARWRGWMAAAACCALAVLGAFAMGDFGANKAQTPDVATFAARSESEAGIVVFDGAGSAVQACGTVTTASETARRWVEETLELAWTAGESVELTAEEYGALLELLESEGADFALESGDTCLLHMQ